MGLLADANRWEHLARGEEERKRIDAEAGHSTAVNDARIRQYRRVAKSLLLEAQTGLLHCACCLSPNNWHGASI